MKSLLHHYLQLCQSCTTNISGSFFNFFNKTYRRICIYKKLVHDTINHNKELTTQPHKAILGLAENCMFVYLLRYQFLYFAPFTTCCVSTHIRAAHYGPP